MRKGFILKLPINIFGFLPALLIFLLVGCSSTGSSNRGYSSDAPAPYQPPPAQPSYRACELPKKVGLSIDVHNFIVNQITLDTTYRCLPDGIRFAERKTSGSQIFLKFVPIRQTEGDSFYLAEIPPVKDGQTSIIAYFYADDAYTTIPDPPKTFLVNGRVYDGRLMDLTIPEISWAPRGFETIDSGTFEGTNIILGVQSKNYPGLVWNFKIPRDDGLFTTVAKLQ